MGNVLNPVKSPMAADAVVEFEKIRIEMAKVSLKVLIWGPTPKSRWPEAPKRRELKEELSKAGHKAMFSEGLSFDSGVLPVSIQELMQVKDKPLTVCIGGSFGPVAEAETLGRLLGPKFLLWLPETVKKGYTGQGLAKTLGTTGRPPQFYGAADLDSCILVTATMHWVEEWRGIALGVEQEKKFLDDLAPAKA